MPSLRGSFSGAPAFRPGTAHEVPDPEAEVAALAFDRQVRAGQICSAEDREPLGRCAEHDEPGRMRRHDPGHCDRAWAAREDAS